MDDDDGSSKSDPRVWISFICQLYGVGPDASAGLFSAREVSRAYDGDHSCRVPPFSSDRRDGYADKSRRNSRPDHKEDTGLSQFLRKAPV